MIQRAVELYMMSNNFPSITKSSLTGHLHIVGLWELAMGKVTAAFQSDQTLKILHWQ